MATWVRTLLVTALPADADPWVPEHLRHLKELKEQGRLRAAGAFPRGDGYVDLFEAEDLLEAERIARGSPLVERGLAAWSLREWRELEL
jgi:uncharacterized protein YciI